MQRKNRGVEAFRRAVATIVTLAMVSSLCLVQPARAEEAGDDPDVVIETELPTDDEVADDELAQTDVTTEVAYPVEDEIDEGEATLDEEPGEALPDAEAPTVDDGDQGQDATVPDQNDVEVEGEAQATEEEIASEEETKTDDAAADAREDDLSAQDAGGANGTTFTVTDAAFGANGSDTNPDSDAINKALDKALESGGAHITVRVPKGTYYLDKPLAISSNTSFICADGVTMIATFGASSMIGGRHYDSAGRPCLTDTSCTHGGYSQIHDVVIEGGVWDRDPNKKFAAYSNWIILLRHGENLTVRNLTVKHATNHMINVSASRNVTIDNVTCEDTIKYTGTDKSYWQEFPVGSEDRFRGLETIHTDFANAEGEPGAYPLDETPTVGVTVTNCTLKNVFAGIGNHHYNKKYKMQDITVSNCSFYNLEGPCVDFYEATGCSMSSCDASNVSRLAYVSDCSDCEVSRNELTTSTTDAITVHDASTNVVVSDNKVSKCTGDAVVVNGGSTGITVSNNSFSGFSGVGVRVSRKSNATVSGNVIPSAPTFGIVVQTGATATCENNKIDAPGKPGLFCTDATLVARKNTVTGSTTSIMVQGSSPNCVIDGNTLTNPTSYGVYITANTGVVVSGNTITKAGKNGVLVTEKGTATITGNKISSPGANGIAIEKAAKATIKSNTIESPAENGIVLNKAASGCTVSSNKVNKAKGMGIWVNDTLSATVDSNTVTDSVGNGICIYGSSTKTSATVKGNTSTSTSTDKKDIYVGGNVTNTTVTNNGVGARGITVEKEAPATLSGNTSSIAGATVSAIANQTYTGKAITPNPTLKFGSTTLKKGTDYTLSYKNNTKIGTATITITGKGSYKGTLSKTFRIVFKDVPTSHRFFEKVHLAAQNDLIAGYSGSKTGNFGPSDNITRGQIAVILWRMAGKPAAGKNAKSFPDVKTGAYYYNAVRWASSVGVVNGYDNGKFGPDDNITRQQLAVMVANYAKKFGGMKVTGKTSDYAKYSDHAAVSSFATTSMAWCCKNGIFVDESGKLNPKKNADRATAAQMAYDLYRIMKK